MGGIGNYPSRTTEVLDLDTLKWHLGPRIPGVSLFGASAVQEGYGFLSVGGENATQTLTDAIYEFDGDERSWKQLDKRLGQVRTLVAAVKVPREMNQC